MSLLTWRSLLRRHDYYARSISCLQNVWKFCHVWRVVLVLIKFEWIKIIVKVNFGFLNSDNWACNCDFTAERSWDSWGIPSDVINKMTGYFRQAQYEEWMVWLYWRLDMMVHEITPTLTIPITSHGISMHPIMLVSRRPFWLQHFISDCVKVIVF